MKELPSFLATWMTIILEFVISHSFGPAWCRRADELFIESRAIEEYIIEEMTNIL